MIWLLWVRSSESSMGEINMPWEEVDVTLLGRTLQGSWHLPDIITCLVEMLPSLPSFVRRVARVSSIVPITGLLVSFSRPSLF